MSVERRILIVEDNATNLKLARLALETVGHQVAVATNADEALASIRASAPKLILMDLQLPGIDGLELTRRLKSDPETRRIPIIAVTAYAMKNDRQRALAAGCDGYLSKPLEIGELRSMINEYLSKSPS